MCRNGGRSLRHNRGSTGIYEASCLHFVAARQTRVESEWKNRKNSGMVDTVAQSLIEATISHFTSQFWSCGQHRQSAKTQLATTNESVIGHLGRDAEAREAAARALEVDPAFTISAWIARGGQSNAKPLIEGFRKAGLPE
jgi:hypothetical protein